MVKEAAWNSHLKMSPTTPDGSAGGKTEEWMLYYVLFPTSPSLIHSEFRNRKTKTKNKTQKTNVKHVRASEFVVLLTRPKNTQMKSRSVHLVHLVD